MKQQHLALTVLAGMVTSSNVGTIASDQGSVARREVWKFVGTKDGKENAFRHLKENEWVQSRADGQEIAFIELGRDDQEIILQNVSSKLIYRLTNGRGFWRRPRDDPDDWKTWVKGEWIVPERVPATATPLLNMQRVVKRAYFVPQDRQPIPNFDRKIGVIMQVFSELYRDDLRFKGYKTEGVQLEPERSQPVVHLIRGKRTAGYYNNAPAYDADEQWRRLVPEIREMLGDPARQVHVVFSETYDDGPSPHNWPGSIALGANYGADGGLAIYTSQVLQDAFCGLTLAEQRQKFFDATPVPGRRAFGSSPNSPRYKFTENGIGAVAHELGHALGLPHDLRRDDVYIMGNGFRNLRRNFASTGTQRVQFSAENALLLMSSRYCNSLLDTDDNRPATVTLQLAVEGSQLIGDVTAEDNAGLRAIVFTDQVRGSIIGGRPLEGKKLSYRERLVNVRVEKGQIEVGAIVTDEGGNQTRVTTKLAVR